MADDTQTTPVFRPCRLCQVPVEQPLKLRQRHQVKDFCCDRHRAAFRDQQAQAAIQRAIDGMQAFAAEAARTAASMEAMCQQLERYRRRPRKKGTEKT